MAKWTMSTLQLSVERLKRVIAARSIFSALLGSWLMRGLRYELCRAVCEAGVQKEAKAFR